MATYAITFRIADEGDRDERYSSFLTYAESANDTEVPWIETTSFLLIKSSLTARSLGELLAESKVSKKLGDKFAVLGVNGEKPVHYGLEFPSIFSSYF